MATYSDIKLTIYFNDTELNSEEQDEQVQRLIAELKEIDEVESVGRVLDPNPPEGNKTLGGFLAGLVKAEVYATNAKKVLGFLGGFLVGKPIELSVEAGGKKLSVKANNPAELEAAIKAAQGNYLGCRLGKTGCPMNTCLRAFSSFCPASSSWKDSPE